MQNILDADLHLGAAHDLVVEVIALVRSYFLHPKKNVNLVSQGVKQS